MNKSVSSYCVRMTTVIYWMVSKGDSMFQYVLELWLVQSCVRVHIPRCTAALPIVPWGGAAFLVVVRISRKTFTKYCITWVPPSKDWSTTPKNQIVANGECHVVAQCWNTNIWENEHFKMAWVVIFQSQYDEQLHIHHSHWFWELGTLYRVSRQYRNASVSVAREKTCSWMGRLVYLKNLC